MGFYFVLCFIHIFNYCTIQPINHIYNAIAGENISKILDYATLSVGHPTSLRHHHWSSVRPVYFAKRTRVRSSDFSRRRVFCCFLYFVF